MYYVDEINDVVLGIVGEVGGYFDREGTEDGISEFDGEFDRDVLEEGSCSILILRF